MLRSIFFSNRVLQINGGIEYGLGNLQLEMAGALLGGWLLVYLIVWRGLHQSGYIIWFTALFPYTVMLTLLVKALTLPGAIDGLAAYINVSWQAWHRCVCVVIKANILRAQSLTKAGCNQCKASCYIVLLLKISD